MKSLEKNPIKGGTPAIENSNIVVSKRQNEFRLKPVNECSVLKFELKNENKVQKSKIKEVLYINI